MKKISVLCLILVLTISCGQNKHAPIRTITQFDRVDIEGRRMEDLIYIAPRQFTLIDSTLLLFMSQPGFAAMTACAGTGEQKEGFGFLGSGPQEYLVPYFSGQNPARHTFSIYDISKKILNEYTWNSSPSGGIEIHFTNERRYSGTIPLFGVQSLDNGFSIGRTISGTPGVLNILDKDLNIISSFINLPEVPEDQFSHLKGDMDSYLNKVVFAMMDIGYVVCFDIDNEGQYEINWEYFLFDKPRYESQPQFKFTPGKHRLGCYDVKMTEKYVYLLYSGEIFDDPNQNLPTRILVFDHDGRPVKQIDLDIPCGRIAVSTDDRYIYGIPSSDMGHIIEYDIEGLLN